MTDDDFMLAVLRDADGGWVAQMDIIARSMAERGCGLTPHSRAATLRERGLTVENRIERRGQRRVSFYRLVDVSAGVPLVSGDARVPALTSASSSRPPVAATASLGAGGCDEAGQLFLDVEAPDWFTVSRSAA